MTRLVTQCLHGMGYTQAAGVLERESGVECLSEPVLRFRESLLRGDWCALAVVEARLPSVHAAFTPHGP